MGAYTASYELTQGSGEQFLYQLLVSLAASSWYYIYEACQMHTLSGEEMDENINWFSTCSTHGGYN